MKYQDLNSDDILFEEIPLKSTEKIEWVDLSILVSKIKMDQNMENILKGLLKRLKKLSATYVLKINVLYNSLPRIEPDFKRLYI